MRTTRLAPSPTGALHLGNARTFLINWLLARRNNWRIVLRIEDLDGPRIKPHMSSEVIDDLQWLGIDWDAGPVLQSSRRPAYQSAIEHLLNKRVAYPCICTRKEVEAAASAPHAEDGSANYPGTCRGRFSSVAAAAASAGREPAIRVEVPTGRKVRFTDHFSGDHAYDVAEDLGDFVIAKADGTPAYQLAVVVDDANMDVTDVVRGDDLLDSTPRQILIYEWLGLAERIPAYYHLPLVIGPDGRRLAKRHGDTRLSYYRESGVHAGRLRALLGRWCGIDDVGNSMSMRDLLDRFELSAVPKQPIVFTNEDDVWLRSTTAGPH